MQSKSLLIPQKKDIETDRLNPQFLGIGKEYVQTHIKRKKIQLQAKQVINNVSYLQKEHTSTNKKLQRKQLEYEILMAVINRRELDNDKKEAMRREREEMLVHQREENMRRRVDNQEKRRNAFLELHSRNYQNYDSVKSTIIKNEQMRKTFKMQELSHKKNLVEHVSQDKDLAKKKINSFFKERNDNFTMTYKEKIKEEKMEQEKANEKIKEMVDKKKELKGMVESSNGRLLELKEQIASIGKIRKSRVRDKFSWANSSYNEETKQQSGELDNNMQKMIQKELNINDASFDS